MAKTQFKGTEVNTSGALPAVGDTAPSFTLVGTDLAERSLADFAGKKVVLTVNPSYDTGVCQATARRFNAELGERGDTVVLMVSADLPFAQKRFCEADGLEHVVPLSTFRSTFARDYGLELLDGPLQGVTARAVLVLDEQGKITHTELVSEITQGPDLEAAKAALG